MPSFSIVICTYNPDLIILARLLNAIAGFNRESPEHEVIIVDNNSTIQLELEVEIKDFLSRKLNSKLIHENTPGLTAARIAGINQAKHDWIVFFDDDNEPVADYLVAASSAIEKYAQVGAWGPGNIDVVYTDKVKSWLETKKELFQQRNEDKIRYANEVSWQPFYPFGTGLIIKKEIALEYTRRVQSGRYTLSDRKGKSLASGGDVQMVLTGIDMGFFAGSIAGLYLNHLINSSKTTLAYLQKQQYGTASAYIKAFNQVFINHQIKTGEVSNIKLLRTIYSLYRIQGAKLNRNDFKLLLASKLGEVNAAVCANDKPQPFILKLYEKLIDA
ncbi:glycosyltransferase [Lacibacter sp. H375]|uniref:glycosyltransferase n=1 Tax=Lacibacter sp. H375 TaxID=3133424 RepID=UPI0030C3E969